MERDQWRWITAALKSLPRTWSDRRQLYCDAEILAIVLRAALWDRSISWACRRSSWPMQAWRRRLPDQSTVSRRQRTPSVQTFLLLLAIARLRQFTPAKAAILDGRPLEVGPHSTDPDAKVGRAAGRMAKGYKVHTLIDLHGNVLIQHTEPMNVAECVVARRLLRWARQLGVLAKGAVILADASYDSNPLHRTARQLGLRLIAPRRRPDRRLCKNRRHEPGRRLSVFITERMPRLWERLRVIRGHIERFFGAWASSGGGLHALPPWVRRLHRVQAWVAAKLVVNAARIILRNTPEVPVAA